MTTALPTSASVLPPTPLLSAENHSGIPKRMELDAKLAKERLYSRRTLPDSVPRQHEVPRLPPNTSRAKFNAAMADLKDSLGDDNVEINDKPLVDGWYMEHPYVGPITTSSRVCRKLTGLKEHSRCVPHCSPRRAGL